MNYKRKLFKRSVFGFSLIELMIVVAIVALLVALALPGYAQFIRKSNRGEAQQLLMNYANLQEIWRSNNTLYGTAAQVPLPTHDLYDFFVRDTGNTCASAAPTATSYTVVACVKSGTDQANDKQAGTTCSPLTVTQANAKAVAVCW